jgi:dolichyl-phosphate-mannose-protein mannosyltransferase
VLALTAVLRFWALDMGLPHPMTRPDEEMILAYTAFPAERRAVAWAVYPPAYIYLTWAWGAGGLAALEAAGVYPVADYVSVLHEHPERVLLVDRALSALAGVATVALLMAATRRALGPEAAVVAGALLATNLLHVRDCHAVKPDALLTLGVMAALAAMTRLAERATVARGAGAGCVIGLAMGMKYPAVLLLAPAWIAAVVGSDARGWRRLVPRAAIAAGLVAAVAFVATSPSLLLDPAGRQGVLSVFRILFPQAFPAPDRPVIPEGLLGLPPPAPWWQGFVYHPAFSLWYGAGWLPTLLMPVGLAWGFRSRIPLAYLAACYAVVHFVVNCLSPATLARYMTPMMPAVAILEGGLVAALVRRAPPRLRGAVLAVATVLLVAQSLGASVAHDRIAAHTDTRVLAGEWIAANVPSGSRVAMLGTQIWGWGEPVVPRTLTVVRPKPEAATFEAEHVQYVVVHDHVLFSSQVDPAAMAALAPRLRLLAEFDPFRGPRADALFEPLDAYYIPMHGFGAVDRPGPRIRVYRFE